MRDGDAVGGDPGAGGNGDAETGSAETGSAETGSPGADGAAAGGGRAGAAAGGPVRMALQVAAAGAVGVVFGAWGLTTLLSTGLFVLVPSPAGRYLAVAGAALPVATVLTAVFSRRGGWLVAAAGLVLAQVAEHLAEWATHGVDASSLAAAYLPVATLGFAGVGVAVGGVLAALARASSAGRSGIAAGFIAGLVLSRVANGLADAVLDPSREPLLSAGTAVLTGATGLAVAAWLATLRRAAADPVDRGPPDGGGPPRSRFRLGPAVVVAVVAVSALAAAALRRVVIDDVRLSRDGLAGPRRLAAVEAFSHYSLVAIAVGVALVLTWYAYRRGGSAAARWVVLGFAVSGPCLVGVHVSVRSHPGTAAATTLVGLLAAGAGVALARRADRVFPWDALGAVAGAAGVLTAADAVRAEFPEWAPAQPLLVAAGAGLALGFGLARIAAPTAPAATAPAAAAPATGESATGGSATGGSAEADADRAGVLALGVAVLTLGALTLAPVIVRSQIDVARDLPLTVPVLAVASAAVLVLLFGWSRAVDRIRRDLRREAAAEDATAGY